MKKTETYFGLENHDGQITADEGRSYCPKLAEMTCDDVNDLILDIENWLEKTLTDNDLQDLKEILL